MSVLSLKVLTFTFMWLKKKTQNGVWALDVVDLKCISAAGKYLKSVAKFTRWQVDKGSQGLNATGSILEQFVMLSWSETSQFSFSANLIHISSFILVWGQTPSDVNAPNYYMRRVVQDLDWFLQKTATNFTIIAFDAL